MLKLWPNESCSTEVVVMSKMKEGRYDGTRTGDKNVLGEFTTQFL